ncbi:MAG: polysaccharide biosynthesis protein [Planctomycetes bacterium]|nr:polysaccharide biosynthesis protein [Planctomycetota bacterium]
MDGSALATAYRGKRILVTGGTGSIGSVLVRRLLALEPAVLRIFSRDETRQCYFEQELGRRGNTRFLIGDVRDLDRLRRALDGIEIVFHAAALKHVPACEYNPFEAVQTNVIGTQNLIQACADARVERCVAISTDKAVSPTNTMGATKLLAERIVQAAQTWLKRMTLCCVRFGNVLGSRGSIVPLLRRKIAGSRRVELTSRESTRFLMTIEDAVDLVLRAGARSRGGELFILPMRAARVADLVAIVVEEEARALGIAPEAIDIVETGLRPGERVHERLASPEEMPHVRADDGLWVIPAGWGGAWGSGRVDPRLLCSETCPRFDREEIRAMLARAGLVGESPALEAALAVDSLAPVR